MKEECKHENIKGGSSSDDRLTVIPTVCLDCGKVFTIAEIEGLLGVVN